MRIVENIYKAISCLIPYLIVLSYSSTTYSIPTVFYKSNFSFYQSFCCFHHLFSSRIHLKFLPINFSIAWHKSQAESNIPPPSCFINSLSSNSTNIAFLLSRLNISSCIYHFNALVLFGKISVLFGNKL